VSEPPAQRAPLVLVSNRGPVTFDSDGNTVRGSGGLVTALTGLASHRDAIWIASAMNEYDAAVSLSQGGRAVAVRETHKLEGGFAPLAAVTAVREGLETWSRLLLRALEADPALLTEDALRVP